MDRESNYELKVPFEWNNTDTPGEASGLCIFWGDHTLQFDTIFMMVELRASCETCTCTIFANGNFSINVLQNNIPAYYCYTWCLNIPAYYCYFIVLPQKWWCAKQPKYFMCDKHVKQLPDRLVHLNWLLCVILIVCSWSTYTGLHLYAKYSILNCGMQTRENKPGSYRSVLVHLKPCRVVVSG